MRGQFAIHAPENPGAFGWTGIAGEDIWEKDGRDITLAEWRWVYADMVLAERGRDEL